MTRKNAVLIGVTALTICITGAAYAGQGRFARQGPGQGRGQGFGPCQTQYQGLTPEKQAVVDNLRKKHWEKVLGLRQDAQARKAMLDALLLDPKADKTKVNETVKALNQAQGKMLEAQVAHRMKMAEQTGVRMPMDRGFRGHGHGPGAMRGCGSGPGPGQRLNN